MGIINLPDNVELILNRLKKYGSIGYVVGGCVRDTFLGKTPNDWDIATGLLPDVVKKVFQDYRVIDTGIKHGTVTVVIDDESYEITTFRIDGTYSDGRHPDDVNFTNKLEDDLKRRDFTINAMAYSPDVGIVDLFGGLNDIEKGIIRCVGSPSERFEEDALRIMRALRFAITLGFRIESRTWYQMHEKRESLSKVSKERICSELNKMMRTQFPNFFDLLYKSLDLFNCISPYFTNDIDNAQQLKERNVLIESLMATNNDANAVVRFALLFQFINNPREVLANLRLDNKTIKSVMDLLNHLDDYKHIDLGDVERKYETRKLINEIGFENTKNLCDLWQAKIETNSPINKFKYLKIATLMKEDAETVKRLGECCDLGALDITGDDLIAIGYEPNKEIGDVLKVLLNEVLHDPYKNKNKWLITWAKELKEKQ